MAINMNGYVVPAKEGLVWEIRSGRPGAWMFVPRGTAHACKNNGDRDTYLITIYLPVHTYSPLHHNN